MKRLTCLIYIYFDIHKLKVLEFNLLYLPTDSLYSNANKLTSRTFVYKSSPSSTLSLVIPEYI